MSPFRREHGSTAEDRAIGIIPFLRAPSASVPSTLRNVDIAFGSTVYDAEGDILPSMTKNLIEVTSKAVRPMGVRLRFFFKPRTHYFPPYLWGEPTPIETLVYDNGFVAELPGQQTSNETSNADSESEDSEWESESGSSTSSSHDEEAT